jgi:hypothetical protein
MLRRYTDDKLASLASRIVEEVRGYDAKGERPPEGTICLMHAVKDEYQRRKAPRA